VPERLVSVLLPEGPDDDVAVLLARVQAPRYTGSVSRRLRPRALLTFSGGEAPQGGGRELRARGRQQHLQPTSRLWDSQEELPCRFAA